MEEKNQKKTLNEHPQQKKLSYEELANVANQLSDQLRKVVNENNQLKNALNEANISNVFTQLQFEMEVLKNKELFPEDFINEIISNIREIMTPKKKEEVKEEE